MFSLNIFFSSIVEFILVFIQDHYAAFFILSK